jgi:hypothetical protein
MGCIDSKRCVIGVCSAAVQPSRLSHWGLAGKKVGKQMNNGSVGEVDEMK